MQDNHAIRGIICYKMVCYLNYEEIFEPTLNYF